MTLTPDLLLSAYAQGYFPMADSADAAELHWFSPVRRGVLPLDDGFHVPRSLRKFMRSQPFELRVSTAFEAVIRGCAAMRDERQETWINDEIIRLYCELAARGHAHSVECWQQGRLAGGLYGVTLGGAFFGESMFSLMPGASKVALVHLVERLRAAGYTLLDTQYVNDHLRQFGVQEVPRKRYLALLAEALAVSPAPSARFRAALDEKGLA